MMNEKLMQEIADERIRQDAKWGEQNHYPARWVTILVEEVGEMAKAILNEDLAHTRKELVQVAAVAIAMLESLDRNELRGIVQAKEVTKDE
jgi:NTP pyrophosphatase (non-canonical NTP hydrolase)